jgi:glycosyltransferase involved in cell wall biosynthesis
MSIDIVFICGSLETTRNGVADFILLLARKLSSNGISCACLAIHDPYIKPPKSSLIHRSRHQDIDIIRIPAVHPWMLKAKLIKEQLVSLRPVNISLHYVPYAYNAKGLPVGLLTSLLPLRIGYRWDITAHELWVDPSSNFCNRLLSKLQRMILLRLCRRLEPVSVHVTNHQYQRQLAKCNIKSSILPLFSSIPLCPLLVPPYRTESQWTFVLFGSINRDWRPEQLLEQINLARRVHGIQSCRFISVGNIGDYGAKLWKSLQNLPYPDFEFLSLGMLSAADVSEQLQLADFGICVSPSLLIGKSSSVAAMLAHGLPIIISRLSAGCEPWHEDLKRSGKYILLDSLFVESLGAVRKYQPEDQLANTSKRFVSALSLTS